MKIPELKIPGWDKKDFSVAVEVRKLINHAGYKALANYWLIQREEFIKIVSSSSCNNRDFSSGALHGFNVAIAMAEKIVSEADRQAESLEARRRIDETLKSR